MKVFDCICVGDSVLDTFLSVEKTEYCKYDEKEEKLILHAGSKILLDTAEFLLGGNASNVAVGLSRLGKSVALVAELGTDEFAEKIKKGLTADNVNLDLVHTTEGAQSTFSVGLMIGGERTLFVHHVVRKHEMKLENVQAEWVYLTSMGKEWREMYKRVLEFIKQTGTKLAFNPGSAQMKEGYEAFKDIVEICDILFVNRDEAEEILYGRLRTEEEKESAESLLYRLQRIGPKTVVITDGRHGSYVLTADNQVYHEGIVPEKKHLGKTGAGDAYSAGFMAGILSGKDIEECMQWGTHEAAAVLEHAGAQTNLLTRKQLEERIEEQKVRVVEEKRFEQPAE